MGPAVGPFSFFLSACVFGCAESSAAACELWLWPAGRKDSGRWLSLGPLRWEQESHPLRHRGVALPGFLKAAALLAPFLQQCPGGPAPGSLGAGTFWVLTVALLMCVKWGACIREFCALVSGVLSISTKYLGLKWMRLNKECLSSCWDGNMNETTPLPQRNP